MTASASNDQASPVGNGAGRGRGATPDEVTVWVGLDVGKENHFAVVLDDRGDELFARSVGNDEADIDSLLQRASQSGTAGLFVESR